MVVVVVVKVDVLMPKMQSPSVQATEITVLDMFFAEKCMSYFLMTQF